MDPVLTTQAFARSTERSSHHFGFGSSTSRASSPTGSLSSGGGYRKPPSPRRRDTAAASMATSGWSPGGESYAMQMRAYTGGANQDLHRFTEGPSAYLNGPPNLRPAFVTRTIATLERTVHDSPRGKCVL